jgi:hypothetical protein
VSPRLPYSAMPLLFVNGTRIDNILTASIASNNCFSADTFSVIVAFGTSESEGVTFWSSLTSAYIEIFTPDMHSTIITGMADSIILDWFQGTAKIEGRDLSSLLIDNSPQQDFVNQTAAEIVAAIASKHSLSPVVSATQGNAGRFFGSDFTRLSLTRFSRIRSEWDLVVQLARESLFDVYVVGTSLYFQPANSSSDTPLVVIPRDLASLKINQTLWINSDPIVNVTSWNSQDMKSYGSVIPSTGTVSPYVFGGANLTALQITDATSRYAQELVRLKVNLVAETARFSTINPRTAVCLDGFASTLDGPYRINNVNKFYSSAKGFRQIISLSAING